MATDMSFTQGSFHKGGTYTLTDPSRSSVEAHDFDGSRRLQRCRGRAFAQANVADGLVLDFRYEKHACRVGELRRLDVRREGFCQVERDILRRILLAEGIAKRLGAELGQEDIVARGGTAD